MSFWSRTLCGFLAVAIGVISPVCACAPSKTACQPEKSTQPAPSCHAQAKAGHSQRHQEGRNEGVDCGNHENNSCDHSKCECASCQLSGQTKLSPAKTLTSLDFKAEFAVGTLSLVTFLPVSPSAFIPSAAAFSGVCRPQTTLLRLHCALTV